jgi:hypothetical protein
MCLKMKTYDFRFQLQGCHTVASFLSVSVFCADLASSHFAAILRVVLAQNHPLHFSLCEPLF